MRIGLQILLSLSMENLCLRLTYIKGDLLFKISPAVGDCIVHVHRIPHDVSQEAYRIVMEFFCSVDDHIPGLAAVLPGRYRNRLTGGSVMTSHQRLISSLSFTFNKSVCKWFIR